MLRFLLVFSLSVTQVYAAAEGEDSQSEEEGSHNEYDMGGVSRELGSDDGHKHEDEVLKPAVAALANAMNAEEFTPEYLAQMLGVKLAGLSASKFLEVLQIMMRGDNLDDAFKKLFVQSGLSPSELTNFAYNGQVDLPRGRIMFSIDLNSVLEIIIHPTFFLVMAVMFYQWYYRPFARIGESAQCYKKGHIQFKQVFDEGSELQQAGRRVSVTEGHQEITRSVVDNARHAMEQIRQLQMPVWILGIIRNLQWLNHGITTGLYAYFLFNSHHMMFSDRSRLLLWHEKLRQGERVLRWGSTMLSFLQLGLGSVAYFFDGRVYRQGVKENMGQILLQRRHLPEGDSKSTINDRLNDLHPFSECDPCSLDYQSPSQGVNSTFAAPSCQSIPAPPSSVSWAVGLVASGLGHMLVYYIGGLYHAKILTRSEGLSHSKAD